MMLKVSAVCVLILTSTFSHLAGLLSLQMRIIEAECYNTSQIAEHRTLARVLLYHK